MLDETEKQGSRMEKHGHHADKHRVEKHKHDREMVNPESMSVSSTTNRPYPDNFVEFLPWACKQLQFDFDVHIHVDKHKPLVKAEDKLRATKSKSNYLLSDKSRSTLKDIGAKGSIISNKVEFIGSKTNAEPLSNVVYITTVVDVHDRIIELKFPRSDMDIPCNLIKLIGLIMPFQPHVHSFTIASGATSDVIKHLSQFLPTTKLTDICLDGAVLEGAQYHLLLDCGQLKCLSLRRCQINDDVVEILASKLEFKMSLPVLPRNGLAALNLSSNIITDRGVQFLAQILRSNRSLCYLNLSGNQITDEGVGRILNVLTNFEMTFDEICTTRGQLLNYLTTKRGLVEKYAFELQSQSDKQLDRLTKKRPSKNPTRVRKVSDSSYNYLAKAEEMAAETVGVFDGHPFAKVNTLELGGEMYCKGNNRLAYLGLNYNNLSVRFLKQLHNVLVMQASDGRAPRGLAMVSIEGNLFPASCAELKLIEFLLHASITRKSSGSKLSSNRSR